MEKHNGTPQYAPEVLQKALGIAGEVQKAEEERKAAKAAESGQSGQSGVNEREIP